MNRIQKFAMAASIAMSLSVFAVGQVSFNEVKAKNANGNAITAVNNSSQTLANAGTTTSADISVWNRVTGFNYLPMSSAYSAGSAINNSNVIVGASSVAGLSQAFVWRPNEGAQFVGSLGGGLSVATGINDSGVVVGLSYNNANLQHAFLWTQADGMQDLTPSLTSVGGATATAINSLNEVVGYYYPNGSRLPVGFSWTQAGGLQDLGPAGTVVHSVNDSGMIVGQAPNAAGYKHAFAWTQSGGMKDLGTLGGPAGPVSNALSVNKNGWVVGTSMTNQGNGFLHAFLWTAAGGMQDLTVLSGLPKSLQPYSVQVNDYGVVAMSTNKGLELLSPKMNANLTSSKNPSNYGQPVTFTVKITSIAGPPPDGELVNFTVNGVSFGSVPLVNGVAQLTTSTIPQGPHIVAVKYVGDANYLSNSYEALQQQVN